MAIPLQPSLQGFRDVGNWAFESVSRWGQDLNVKQAAPTSKKGHFDMFERI
jgi:hypothetical protein